MYSAYIKMCMFSVICVFSSVSFAFEFTIGKDYSSGSSFCSGDFEKVDSYLYQSSLLNQKDMGVCYAHSAAQIYNSLYHDIYGESVLVSPLSLSLNESAFGYKSGSFRHASLRQKLLWMIPVLGWSDLLAKKQLKSPKLIDLLDGGFCEKTLKDTKKFKICPHGAIENFLSICGQEQGREMMLDIMHKYVRWAYYYSKQTGISFPPSPAYFRLPNAATDQCVSQAQIRLWALYDFLRKHPLEKHPVSGKPHAKRNVVMFLQNLCKSQSLKNLVSGKDYKIKHVSDSAFRVSDALWAHLSTNRSTRLAEIGYCVKYLQHGHSQKGCGPHSSVVYGVACRQGRREFLIRNSWGGMTLAEQRRRGNLPLDEEKISRHDRMRGDFWVTEGYLSTALMSSNLVISRKSAIKKSSD